MAIKIKEDSIPSNELAKLLATGKAQIEAHSYMPYFEVDDLNATIEGISKTEIDNDRNEKLLSLGDSWYNIKIFGKNYLWMGSDGKNPDGSWNGQQASYFSDISETMQNEWISLLGEDKLVSFEEMRRMIDYQNMDLEDYRQLVLENLTNEINDVTFELPVISTAKGEEKIYTINLKSVSELESQLNRASIYGGIIQAHDDSLDDHEDYSIEEATKLYTDVSIAVAYRNGQLGAYKKRARLATTNEELYNIKELPLTEAETLIIQTMVMKSLGQ